MSDLDEPDIDALHSAVLRERQEPFEGREPVPAWMIVAFGALIAWGGWYVGRYTSPVPVDVEAAAEAPDLAALGAQVYASRCAACHQPTGRGMPGVAPPLAGSDWVTGDEQRLIRVVLHGLQGPIEVSGQRWDGAMPPWGASLTDDQVGAVLTYARSAWGNDAPPVQPDSVARVRASSERSKPWTAPEL